MLLVFEDGSSVPPHRHPGSVYIYVLEGAVLLEIEGEPERVVAAGESFFEPAGGLHTRAENANPDGPSRALAIIVGPEGAPLATGP